MKKNFTLFKGLLVAFGLLGGVNVWAQTTLPEPVYLLDFEGATNVTDFGGVQHGDGALMTSSDSHFGKYYQNWPNVDQNATATVFTNFLEVIPTTNPWATIKATNSNAFTISFWSNATVANTQNIGNDWGSLFVGYTSAGTAANRTWYYQLGPDLRVRGQFHYNNYGYTDDNHDSYLSTVAAWKNNNNWHHFAWVFSGLGDSQTFNLTLYLDGSQIYSVNETITGANTTGFDMLNDLDRFVIGGASAIWDDPDNAYGYDDIALYSSALTAEQIQSIVTSKVGQHAWSAKAYATINNVKTEIDTWTGSNVMEDATYNVWAKRVIKHDGQYYELDDNKFFGSSTSFSATMGSADVEYEISYTLNEDIVYYSEGEVFGQNTASETASGGAYCNYYAGPTTVSGLTANQVYRLETNVVDRNDKSSLEIYQTEGTASFAKIDKNHGTGYNTIYFTPTETSVRVGGPYYSDKFQNSLSFDYILIRKYDIVNPAGILGTLDKASSWTQSDAYTLKQGETKVFTFKNHGYGVDNSSEKSWYNWIVYMYEGETSKAETRADFWDNKKGETLGYQAMSTDGGSTKTWVDWSKFREDMDDAVVVATLTYQDGTYSISAESTAAKSGYIYYVNHSVTDLTGDLTIKISIDHSWMEMLSVESNLVTATIGSTGYTTFSSSYPLNLTGIKAYYIASGGVGSDKAVLTEAPETVAAGEGLILAGTPQAVISIPVAATGSAIPDNLLVGCPTATDVTTPNANAYVLVNNDGAEFQPLSGNYTDNKVTIPAGKAYLKTSTSANGANLRVVFAGEATGIANIEAAKTENGAMFNMAGQRVDGSYKGIVIKNGKKVWVK